MSQGHSVPWLPAGYVFTKESTVHLVDIRLWSSSHSRVAFLQFLRIVSYSPYVSTRSYSRIYLLVFILPCSSVHWERRRVSVHNNTLPVNMAGKGGHMTSAWLEAAQHGSFLEKILPASLMLLAMYHSIIPEIQRAAIWTFVRAGEGWKFLFQAQGAKLRSVLSTEPLHSNSFYALSLPQDFLLLIIRI